MPRGKKKSAKPSKKTQPSAKIFKKRGRKPKGGKIVSKANLDDNVSDTDVPNIILHLKCSSKDLETNGNPSNLPLNAFNSYSGLNWKTIQEKNIPKEEEIISEDSEPTNKIIWRKLKELEKRLHFNDVLDKKSNCFFCTYPFNNPPVYIPRQERDGIL